MSPSWHNSWRLLESCYPLLILTGVSCHWLLPANIQFDLIFLHGTAINFIFTAYMFFFANILYDALVSIYSVLDSVPSRHMKLRNPVNRKILKKTFISQLKSYICFRRLLPPVYLYHRGNSSAVVGLENSETNF